MSQLEAGEVEVTLQLDEAHQLWRSYPNMEKAMKVNPNRKLGMEPQMQLAVNTDNFPVTATTNPTPNVMPCIPTDLVGTAKRERERAYSLGITHPSYTINQVSTIVS